jgi:dTDP-4-dehydrorhamnose reductase
MTATILITGAGGQVGHELALGSSRHRLAALTRAELDITDPPRIEAAFDRYNPGVVINAAAYTQVDRAESEPEQAYAINRDAVSHLAHACHGRGLPLLHVSTDYVYSGEGEGDYREDDATAARSVYGESKAAGDEALRAAMARHIILRTSWVFSATGNNFVRTMLRLGSEREELGIVDDQHGCPTSARSIALVLLQIADRYLDGETIPWGTYHFCNSPATTWYDFAARIFELAGGYEGLTLRRISTPEYPTPARRPMNSTLNCDKLQAKLGIALPEWPDELRLVLAQLKA